MLFKTLMFAKILKKENNSMYLPKQILLAAEDLLSIDLKISTFIIKNILSQKKTYI